MELIRPITGLLDWDDFAVLLRTNASSRAFEQVFVANDVPYRLVGGARFFDREEVQDLLAYLRVVFNPHDQGAFERAVRVPKRNVGPKTLALIFDAAKRNHCSPLTALRRMLAGSTSKLG